MHILLCFRLWVLLHGLHLARVKVSSTHQVTEVWNLWPPEVTLLDLHSKPSPLQRSEDLPKMIKVLLPTSAVNHNVICIGSGKALTTTEYVIDHLLESCRSAVETKGHYCELKNAKRGNKGRLLPRSLGHGNLLVITAQVQGCDHCGRANTLEHLFDARHRVGIKHGQLV